MEVQEKYLQAIAAALDLPADFKLLPETEIAKIPGWDSLAWVAVISALEELSGKDFPVDNVANIKTLGQLIQTL